MTINNNFFAKIVKVMKTSCWKLIIKQAKLTSERAADIGYEERHQQKHTRDDKGMHVN